MANTGASSSASSTYKYDVFLSFRGEDTRFGFTGNLYSALKKSEINAFIDDLELKKGTEIAPSLITAIRESRIAMVVFSKSYASSSFCLDELFNIIECHYQKNQLVLPVFYDVDFYDVRMQTGPCGQALAELWKKLGSDKEEKLRKWKIALKDLSDLSGYHVQHGYESEHNHIVRIVEDVSARIKQNSQLQNLTLLSNDLHVVGGIAPSPCSSSSIYKYDAFINFRGRDTRFGFTGNLYSALKDRGIKAFIADMDLDKGTKIAPALFRAVELSKTAIVVLSKKYALSAFGLDELVKIMESIKDEGRLVIPVFYDVDPSEVRKLNGDYGRALAKQEIRYKDNPQRLQRWRKALKQVANLSGFHFQHGSFLYEHDFIAKIVEHVSIEIRRDALPVDIHPPGLDSQIQNITPVINNICETGEYGPTTPRTANNSMTTMQPHATTKSFPDVSNIEMFEGRNFKRWQERVLSLLSVHGVANALTNSKPESSVGQQKLDDWIYANKVCRHTILSTLSDQLFNVYCSYKEANKIWESMIFEFIVNGARRQKLMIKNYYRWEMTEAKDIQVQINEYRKLLNNLKEENIILPEEFVVGMFIEKLPDSWKDYKQQLNHKNEKLSLLDLMAHITAEDNRKKIKEKSAETLVSRTNPLHQDQTKNKNDICTAKFDNLLTIILYLSPFPPSFFLFSFFFLVYFFFALVSWLYKGYKS